MHRFCRLAAAASLSLAIVSFPAITVAATDVTYAIRGAEYSATTTVGSFAGVAVATDDYGGWLATIVHDSLDSNPAAVTGGSFTLNGKDRDLSGTIGGGSITLLTTSTCGKQTYQVNGSLTLTGGGGSGTATIGAVLSHYRISVWGRCITYAATVRGSVTFHLV